jgi:hypothetical protein
MPSKCSRDARRAPYTGRGGAEGRRSGRAGKKRVACACLEQIMRGAKDARAVSRMYSRARVEWWGGFAASALGAHDDAGEAETRRIEHAVCGEASKATRTMENAGCVFCEYRRQRQRGRSVAGAAHAGGGDPRCTASSNMVGMRWRRSQWAGRRRKWRRSRGTS